MSITLLHKWKLKTLNFEATRFNTLFELNSPLILKLTTKYLGIFFPSKVKASDAVSYILSMTTDQIVNNYTLWSTNCPWAEHFISIAKTPRGSFVLTKDICQRKSGYRIRPFNSHHARRWYSGKIFYFNCQFQFPISIVNFFQILFFIVFFFFRYQLYSLIAERVDRRFEGWTTESDSSSVT